MHLQQNLPLFHVVGSICLFLHSRLPYSPALLLFGAVSVESGQCRDVQFVFITPLPARKPCAQ